VTDQPQTIQAAFRRVLDGDHEQIAIWVRDHEDVLLAALAGAGEQERLRTKFCEAHLREILDGSHYGYDDDDPKRSADGIGGCGICKGERLEGLVGRFKVRITHLEAEVARLTARSGTRQRLW